MADALSAYGTITFSGTGTYTTNLTLVDLAAQQLQTGTTSGKEELTLLWGHQTQMGTRLMVAVPISTALSMKLRVPISSGPDFRVLCC